ncbi:MAG: hypothetical protein WA945_00760 [Arcobacteraceae bacterium]
MYRFFVVTLITVFFTTLLSGSILKEKVENIIGQNDYKAHSGLINLLFKNESLYIINDKIKYHKLFKTLQENGLLNLQLNRPSDIEIEFIGLNKHFKSYKILNDTMQVLGFRYFFTKSMNRNSEDHFVWNIVFKAEYMIDPVMLLNELQQANSVVTKVVNNGNNKWTYEIDFQNAELSNAIKIAKNERVSFQKPLSAYMLKVESAQNLQVISRSSNHWFPHIVFFDKDLKVLEVIKENKIQKGVRVDMPDDTRYIKITDLYNLINIKRGLSIIVR